MHMSAGTHRGQKWVPDVLKLELQAAVSHTKMRVLESELGCSGRAEPSCQLFNFYFNMWEGNTFNLCFKTSQAAGGGYWLNSHWALGGSNICKYFVKVHKLIKGPKQTLL